MKKTPLLILTLLIIIGGYFITTHTKKDADTSIRVSGEVTDISREEIIFDGPTRITIRDENGTEHTIAIPSMGIQLCAAREHIADVAILAVGDLVSVSGTRNGAGDVVPCSDTAHFLNVTGFVSDAVFGFEFAYRKGPDGYVTLQDNESADPEYVTGITLINKREYEIFQDSTDAREGPTALHVRVYRNDANLHAPVWVMQNPRESNIELALGEPQEAVVGGANAVFYTVDGLYPIGTYVVAHGDYMYVLMGSYMDTQDQIYADFAQLVSSFTFIQIAESAPDGRINIQTACEHALTYMTFENGETADAFVAACITGEFPEVIERYINDMGWDRSVI